VLFLDPPLVLMAAGGRSFVAGSTRVKYVNIT